MEKRGLDFAEHIAGSLFSKKMMQKGYSIHADTNEYDKDYGDGHVMWFDCGEVLYSKGATKVHIYQSRFSDQSALEINGDRISSWLIDIDKFDSKLFVGLIMKLWDL